MPTQTDRNSTASTVPAEEKTLFPYWTKVVFVFFLGWIFMYADRTILNPVMKNIQSEFGLSKSDLGLISSVFFLSYAAMQIPAGVLGDKIGRKIVLVPGFLLFGIFTGVSGMMKSFNSFLFARFLTGIGEGTYYGPQYALSSEAIPQKYRSLGSAIINSGMAFGISLGFLASSYITLDLGMSWQTPFYIFAAPTIITGLLIWWVVKEGKRNQPVGTTAEVTQKVSVASLFKNRNLLMTYIMVFCSLYGFFMILTWLPYYLQTERGIQGSQIGIISSLVPWASIPGALFFSYVSDRIGRRKPLAFILVPLAAISICATVYIQDYNMLLAALVFYGLTGKLALDPVLVAFVADNAPKNGYSTAFGVYNFVGMSSSILAPFITGYIADVTGTLTAGFYISAALLMFGLVCMAFTTENKQTVTNE